ARSSSRERLRNGMPSISITSLTEAPIVMAPTPLPGITTDLYFSVICAHAGTLSKNINIINNDLFISYPHSCFSYYFVSQSEMKSQQKPGKIDKIDKIRCKQY